jgi:hypothetical protein
MSEIIYDNGGERMEANSCNDSSEKEKEKRRDLARGGV